MLNIVIPMAGAGSRFSIAGYEDPKPLIKIHDMPMINFVIRNLAPDQVHRFIFICQNKHIKQYDLTNKLTKWSPNSIVIGIDGLTEGAACTVLFAKKVSKFSKITFSLLESKELVASSKKTNCGFLYTARAIKIRCFCPWLIPVPSAPIFVLKPRGSSLIN